MIIYMTHELYDLYKMYITHELYDQHTATHCKHSATRCMPQTRASAPCIATNS